MRPEKTLHFIARPAAAQSDQPKNDALEQYAFSVGLQAYLYGYPLVITEVSRETRSENLYGASAKALLKISLLYRDELSTEHIP